MKGTRRENAPSGGGRGVVARRLFEVGKISVGQRRATCPPAEAARLVTAGGPDPAAGVIAVTEAGRLLQGRKLLAACAARGVSAVEAVVVAGSPDLDALVRVCDRLAAQLTPLQLVVTCAEGYSHYVAIFPETERGRWRREKRSDFVSRPSFAAVVGEALGRSTRWAQESAKIGRGLDPQAVGVVSEREPDARRAALRRLSGLTAEVQKEVAGKVKLGEKLEDALGALDESAADDGAKVAGLLAKLAKLLRRIEGWEEYAAHETVSAVLTAMRDETGLYVPVLLSVAECIQSPAAEEDGGGWAGPAAAEEEATEEGAVRRAA